MMRRAVAAAAAVAVLATMAVPAYADDPLQAARDAATGVRFRATVSVQWVDGNGVHDEVVDVRSDQGRVDVAGLQWSTGALLHPPAPGPKYDLRTGPGAGVAGRPTTAVEVFVNGRLRERLALDRATSLVLERVQFDSTGGPTRVVRIESLSVLPPDDIVVPAPVEAPSPLPSRYRAPATLAAGYEQVAAYRRGDIAHVVYSDGLHGLSVFLQPGRLDDGRLSDVMWVAMGKRTAAVRSWPGGVTVTWEAGGVVYTAVGDGPVEDVVTAAGSMPPPASPSTAARARQRARAVAETLLGRSA
jgi:hypothetical protein